jgi:hypothetical protein
LTWRSFAMRRNSHTTGHYGHRYHEARQREQCHGDELDELFADSELPPK